MRTSRGLRITSLIVVSPVILILISLVVILAIAVQSQLKAWYFAAVSTLPQHQPFFSEPSSSQHHHHQFINARSISRLASTAFVFSYNHPTTHQLSLSSPSPSSTSNSLDSNRFDMPKTTVARRILPRLKRLLPSSTWIGVLTVFAFITLQKVPLHQPLKSIASCISSPADNDREHSTVSKPSSATQHGNKRRKKTKRIAAASAIRQSKPISASAAQPAAQHNQQQQQTQTTPAPAPTTTTDHMRCTEGATLINPVLRQSQTALILPTLESHDDQLSIESSDDDESKWINVGGKKNKRSSSIKPEAIAAAIHAHAAAVSVSDTKTTINTDTVSGTESMAESSMTEEEEVIAKEEDDDDDDTATTSSATEDEVESITKTPVMEKPRIQSWYSPFSTGLDLDIMPKGSDLLLNKPLAPPMNGDLFFRHHQLEQWRSQQEYPVTMMMHHHHHHQPSPPPRRAEQPFTFFDHYSY